MPTFKTIEITQAFHGFDAVLDVRSPAEYADDHFPGAISVPVLSDEQRAHIGTVYKQVSPFEAKKQGAALIARNIARHVEARFSKHTTHWHPLVYCWRGGMRSGAMAHVLAQIGWKTSQLEGGYKSYRRHVLAGLEALPTSLEFCVITGPTGSGKTRLLHALAAEGAQVLDLEKLAQHRGSLLGKLPGQSQPSQKTFETLLWQALHSFKPSRRVYIEAESRKVGELYVPDALHARMRASGCVRIETDLHARVGQLMYDYAHFLRDPVLLVERLAMLKGLYPQAVIDRWCDMARQNEWEPLVEALLVQHYDPAYSRSSGSGFGQMQHAQCVQLGALDPETLQQAAKNLVGEHS
jgi:tRNA 2-selenouridine synthase